MPGEMVNMLIELDNTGCTANITSIQISVTNTVTLRSQGRATSDTYTVFRKGVNGVPAGMAYTVFFILFREKKQ